MSRNAVLDYFVYSTEFNDFMDEVFGILSTPNCESVDRFLDNNDGTVTDCRTDLLWLKTRIVMD